MSVRALAGICFAFLAATACGSARAPSSTLAESNASPFVPPAPAGIASPPPWVVAYYNGLSNVSLPASELDMGAFTHLMVFALLPTDAGGIDDTTKMLDPTTIASVATAAHAAGKKVLVTVGGADSHALFASALSDANSASFVAALAAYVAANGYDGVDIDMEPIGPADDESYAAFIIALRAALPAGALLTAATVYEPALFASLQASLDRVDVMTYHFVPQTPDLVWHNAALYSGGAVDPSSGEPLPSCDALLARFVDAGVARAKLGIGIDFNGEVWTGASVLGVARGAVTATAVSYAQVMDEYYASSAARWDGFAQAPYLSFSGGDPSPALVSYDDPTLIADKLAYVHTRALGSVIVWSLQAGYRPDQPEGQRSPLLEAVKLGSGLQ
jgi:chitinase